MKENRAYAAGTDSTGNTKKICALREKEIYMSKNISMILSVLFAVLAVVFTLMLCLSAAASSVWSALMVVCFLLMAACITSYMLRR